MSLKVQRSWIALIATVIAFSFVTQASFANGVEEPPPQDEVDCEPTPEPEPEPTPEPEQPTPPSDDDSDAPAPIPPDVLVCALGYSNKATVNMSGNLTSLSVTAPNLINNEVVLSVKRKMLTPNYLTVNITDAQSNAMIVEKDVCWQKTSDTDEMGRRIYKAKFSTSLVEATGKRSVGVLCDLMSAKYVKTCAKTFKAPDVMAN